MIPPANFNRIARPYRWLEYLTLGSALMRCRLHFLPRILHSRRALVIGDGDGRFLARLLSANPHLVVDAVDLSPAMLHLLRQRALAASPTASHRLRTYSADALAFDPPATYDLVVTHFFLDCLSQAQLDQLSARLAPHLAPGALWLLSDFRIPSGHLQLPARIFVRLLYLAFRLLTGLRTTRLPDHSGALTAAGLTPIARHTPMFGVLLTEIWQRQPISPLYHPTQITASKEAAHGHPLSRP